MPASLCSILCVPWCNTKQSLHHCAFKCVRVVDIWGMFEFLYPWLIKLRLLTKSLKLKEGEVVCNDVWQEQILADDVQAEAHTTLKKQELIERCAASSPHLHAHEEHLETVQYNHYHGAALCSSTGAEAERVWAQASLHKQLSGFHLSPGSSHLQLIKQGKHGEVNTAGTIQAASGVDCKTYYGS